MKKIALIGTGNIGKRYLQAIHTADVDVPVVCYDRKQKALESIRPFLKKYGINDRSKKIYSYEEAIGKIDDDTLAIVATTAEGRIDVLLDVVEESPKYVISEKPVTQTEAQYSSLVRKCNTSNVPAYVNYYLRFQPFVEEIKRISDLSFPFYMDVRLPGNGIACNGIHFLDLFLWLSGARQNVVESMNFGDIYEQKRSGFWDLYGRIDIRTERGDECSILNSKMIGNQAIVVESDETTLSIYEEREKMSVVGEGKSEFQDVNSLYASEYLVEVVERYAKGRWNDGGRLTPLEEAMYSHRILFQFLRFANCPGLNIT